jgi:hypothetical protein
LLAGGTSWASAVDGASASAPASNAIPKRETALIRSRFLSLDCANFSRRHRHMPAV